MMTQTCLRTGRTLRGRWRITAVRIESAGQPKPMATAKQLADGSLSARLLPAAIALRNHVGGGSYGWSRPIGQAPGPPTSDLWVPVTLSQSLIWSFVLDEVWSGWVSGCAGASRSGTVGTRVDAIRLPGGAARVRLACPARPVRPRQGRRNPHLAPSVGRAPAPGQEP